MDFSKTASVNIIRDRFSTIEEYGGNARHHDNKIDESTFEFVQYTLDSLYDCKWLNLINTPTDYGLYWILINIRKPHLAGIIFDYWHN